MPEQIWVWPLDPLDELKNRQVPRSDVEAGQTIDVIVGQEPARSNLFTGEVSTWRRIPCRYYRPSAAELADMKRHYPESEPGNPSWPRIEADLIAAGHERDTLVTLNAPTLLRLLGTTADMIPEPNGNEAPAGRREGASSHEATEQARRGRRSVPESESQKRIQLLEKWEHAKDAGVGQKDFCDDNGVTLKYLTNCINWRAQRRRRGEP